MSHHIVIVDDDPDAREILEIILKTLEIPIIQVTNGKEALELILKEPPLLVLLDLSMPKVDGYQVLRKLRSNATTVQLPVIVFTAQQVTAEMQRALQIPQSMILRKGDVSMTHLRDMVIRILHEEIEVDLSLLQVRMDGMSH